MQYGVEGSGINRSMNVSGDNTSQAILSELTPSTNYTIKLLAVNSAGPGVESVPIFSITLGEKLLEYMTYRQASKILIFLPFFLVVPPVVTVKNNASTNLSISWTTGGLQVMAYEVMWERDSLRKCPDVDEGRATITGTSIKYTITELEEDSSYAINVTAINAAGRAISDPVTAATGEAGDDILNSRNIEGKKIS